jgi:hypothetical protein
MWADIGAFFPCQGKCLFDCSRRAFESRRVELLDLGSERRTEHDPWAASRAVTGLDSSTVSSSIASKPPPADPARPARRRRR